MIIIAALIALTIAQSCPACGTAPDCPDGQLLNVQVGNGGCPSCPSCATPNKNCSSSLCPLALRFCDPSQGLTSLVTYNFDSNNCPGCAHQSCVNATTPPAPTSCPEIACLVAAPTSCTPPALLAEGNVDANGCPTDCGPTCRVPPNNCSLVLCPLALIACVNDTVSQSTYPFDPTTGCPGCANQKCVPAPPAAPSPVCPAIDFLCPITPVCDSASVLVQPTDENGCVTGCLACRTPSNATNCPHYSCPIGLPACFSDGLTLQTTWTLDSNGCLKCPQASCVASTSTTSAPTACPPQMACAQVTCSSGMVLTPAFDNNNCPLCPSCQCADPMCGAAAPCANDQVLINQYDANSCALCPSCQAVPKNCSAPIACPLALIYCDPYLGQQLETSYDVDESGCPGCPYSRCVPVSSSTTGSGVSTSGGVSTSAGVSTSKGSGAGSSTAATTGVSSVSSKPITATNMANHGTTVILSALVMLVVAILFV